MARRSNRKQRLALAMVPLAAWALVIAAASPALAVLPICNVAQHIFVRASANAADTRGSTNTSLVRTRDLDNDCQGITFSTAHIARGLPGSGLFDQQVEMGWQRIRQADGSIILCEFWEKQYVSIVVFDNRCGSQTSVAYGQDVRLRISNVSGTDKWQPAIDYLNGGGFHDRGDPFQTAFDRGFAMGETERKGNDTGMVEDQTNLDYYKVVDGPDEWRNYPGVNCILDETGDWSWHRVTDNSYTVTHEDNAC